MGDWRLEIFDNTNTTRQAVIPRSDVASGTRVEELNGEDTLIFSMDRGSIHFDTIDLRDIIRLVDLGGNTSKSFRVRSIRDERQGDTIRGVVDCEHIKYDMLAEIYSRWKPFVSADPDAVIDDILGFSTFSSSTINPATLIDAVLNFGSVFELLEGVRQILDTDMVVNEDSTIKFGAQGANNNVRIRYAKNIRGINRIRDVHEFYNKLYTFGAGEPPTSIGGFNDANIQGAEHIIESHSSKVTINLHERMVVTNDSLNNLYAEITRAKTSVAIGERQRILDSVANDSIIMATAFSNTVITGDYLKIVSNATGDEVSFVRDQQSINSFGTLSASLAINDIPGTVNLLLTPALDGTYSSGISENWTEVGSVTTKSENTDDDFIRFGNASQHLTGADSGEGIQQLLTLVNGDFYSQTVWIFVVTGSVRIEFFDGNIDQPSGSVTAETTVTGTWVQILMEGIEAKDTDGIVKILSNSAGSEFYVDAVMVEKLSRFTSPSEFIGISGARRLWDRAVDDLRQHNSPRKTYVVGVADLYEGDREVYQYDQFVIGDTITIQDDELGIDVTARVQRKEWSVFDPWDVKIQLDNFSDRIGRTLRKREQSGKKEILNIGIENGRLSAERIVGGNKELTGRTELRQAE